MVQYDVASSSKAIDGSSVVSSTASSNLFRGLNPGSFVSYSDTVDSLTLSSKASYVQLSCTVELLLVFGP